MFFVLSFSNPSHPSHIFFSRQIGTCKEHHNAFWAGVLYQPQPLTLCALLSELEPGHGSPTKRGAGAWCHTWVLWSILVTAATRTHRERTWETPDPFLEEADSDVLCGSMALQGHVTWHSQWRRAAKKKKKSDLRRETSCVVEHLLSDFRPLSLGSFAQCLGWWQPVLDSVFGFKLIHNSENNNYLPLIQKILHMSLLLIHFYLYSSLHLPSLPLVISEGIFRLHAWCLYSTQE